MPPAGAAWTVEPYHLLFSAVQGGQLNAVDATAVRPNAADYYLAFQWTF